MLRSGELMGIGRERDRRARVAEHARDVGDGGALGDQRRRGDVASRARSASAASPLSAPVRGPAERCSGAPVASPKPTQRRRRMASRAATGRLRSDAASALPRATPGSERPASAPRSWARRARPGGQADGGRGSRPRECLRPATGGRAPLTGGCLSARRRLSASGTSAAPSRSASRSQIGQATGTRAAGCSAARRAPVAALGLLRSNRAVPPIRVHGRGQSERRGLSKRRTGGHVQPSPSTPPAPRSGRPSRARRSARRRRRR